MPANKKEGLYRPYPTSCPPGTAKEHTPYTSLEDYVPKEEYSYKYYRFIGLLPKRSFNTGADAKRGARLRWGPGQYRILWKTIFGKGFWVVYAERGCVDGSAGSGGAEDKPLKPPAGEISAGGDGTDTGGDREV